MVIHLIRFAPQNITWLALRPTYIVHITLMESPLLQSSTSSFRQCAVRVLIAYFLELAWGGHRWNGNLDPNSALVEI